MVCKTRGKGSYGNSPTQDQRKEPKPENNFKKKEKAISLCPNQLNHTIKGASSIGNSTYCELTTELYTHTHTHTHTHTQPGARLSPYIPHRKGRFGHYI